MKIIVNLPSWYSAAKTFPSFYMQQLSTEAAMETHLTGLDPRSPVFIPWSNLPSPSFHRSRLREHLGRGQPLFNDDSNSAMAHLQSSRLPRNLFSPSLLLPSQVANNTHHMLHQGENSSNYGQSMSYEPMYSEGSSAAAGNSIESDLVGGLYPPDANGVPPNMFSPHLNQSLTHQPVRRLFPA